MQSQDAALLRPGELGPEQTQEDEQRLRSLLAGPNEQAFQQILADVRIVQADSVDTNLVYDIQVSFDPSRYRSPHLGAYPLTFEDQLIIWGRRISYYTNVTPWHSGRFYLHDLASGRQVWIWTEDTRRLHPPPPKPKPGKKPKTAETFPAGPADLRIDLRTMGQWFRLAHEEPPEQVRKRLQDQSLPPRISPPAEPR